MVAGNPVLLRLSVRPTVHKKKSESSFMTSKSAHQPAALPKNLKRTFENAVRDIYQAGLTGKISQYRTPIVQRAGVPNPSGPNAEKQALSDAAKALAELWKVSPSR